MLIQTVGYGIYFLLNSLHHPLFPLVCYRRLHYNNNCKRQLCMYVCMTNQRHLLENKIVLSRSATLGNEMHPTAYCMSLKQIYAIPKLLNLYMNIGTPLISVTYTYIIGHYNPSVRIIDLISLLHSPLEKVILFAHN